jgi:23S rRNA (adenine2503-C2)-methyltransferase
MSDIKDLTLEELSQVMIGWKQEGFHAKQIFSWIYKKGAGDFQAMSDLPLDLRKLLKERFYLFGFNLEKRRQSRDGTEKFLFALKDGNLIETVSIPTETRLTLCLSTQAGCRFACAFCASGMLGLRRNLTAGEIIEQVLYVKNNSAGRSITNLVFMGIGEPLDNYDNVLKAIRILNSAQGINIGARKITISTCGIIPGIKQLAQEGLQIELSVSLHAADDRTRSAIIPANKKYPLNALLKTCREYISQTNRQVTFEYVLIKGVNSDLQNAQNLCRILGGLNCKVNLIPASTIKERNIAAPHKLEILLFRDYLAKHNINVTLRKPRGGDIDAACGQLRLRYVKK